MAEIPASLVRRGLTAVSDNVPAGMQVGGFARDFALLFREELFSRLATGGKTCGEESLAPASSASV